MSDVVIKLNRDKLIAAFKSIISESHPPGDHCNLMIETPKDGHRGWYYECCNCSGYSVDSAITMRALLLECLAR